MSAPDPIQSLKAGFGSEITGENEFRGEQSLSVKLSALHAICLHARDALGFDYIVDISSVDHFGEEPRFEMVYELYSM